ncbi:polysaccharide pyruvyl transferase family protein [Mycolicibacterium sphagni]|uniref:polysaccharide pyruvyl transferase family protein n=1 Tax=Mycolicibacterium sphagni TaxID=1786 RepID=UPI0021F35EF6|nr:polysaccharide pyruvyl transferase family protein [Mycolicibacterium sphagni]MCV7175099.1 polysaccharide pyruvyl transferase family protein [Mycolicibacterium sphagni]
MSPARNIYWWRQHPNFGDRLNGFLLMHNGVSPHWAAPANADLILVGSVLEHLPKGWAGTIAGAGLMHPHSRIDLSQANILALRGKLTARRVTGTHPGMVLGDPGLLASRYVHQPTAKHALGIVPHWSDTQLAGRYPQGYVIDVTQHPEQVIAHIASCKRIISSSLHGLVVADSFGIPRQAELFPNARNEGGDFKYRDYATLFDGDPHFGEMWRAPHHTVERLQNQLADVLAIALDQTPHIPVPYKKPHEPCVWRPRPKLSLLVPFRDDGEHRTLVWRWLHQFWRHHLPDAEIVIGHYDGVPFNKAAAINHAASRARGRVFAITDADAYINPAVIEHCTNNIIAAVKQRKRVWYMPYDHLYRLDRYITMALLNTDPAAPFTFPQPPPADWCEPGTSASYGHLYGAMMQIMPRQAFFAVGGADPRFNRGWGSEDACLMRALDTLYTPHQVVRADMMHLWHVRPGSADHRTRTWAGQQIAGMANSRLAERYAAATGEHAWMRDLVDEHIAPTPRSRWRP